MSQLQEDAMEAEVDRALTQERLRPLAPRFPPLPDKKPKLYPEHWLIVLIVVASFALGIHALVSHKSQHRSDHHPRERHHLQHHQQEEL